MFAWAPPDARTSIAALNPGPNLVADVNDEEVLEKERERGERKKEEGTGG